MSSDSDTSQDTSSTETQSTERTWHEDSRGLTCSDSMPPLVSSDASSEGTSMETDASYGSEMEDSTADSSGYEPDVEGSVSVQ